MATAKVVASSDMSDPMLAFSGPRDIHTAIQKREEAETQKLIAAAIAHQTKCEIDAELFLDFYWGNNSKYHTIEIGKMREWLDQNQPLDRWFFVRLIEAAGEKALKLGYSQYKAEIARMKNIEPRSWVQSEWAERVDKKQTKAAFSRQYAALVKAKFRVNVTSVTIANDWLPKGNIAHK